MSLKDRRLKEISCIHCELVNVFSSKQLSKSQMTTEYLHNKTNIQMGNIQLQHYHEQALSVYIN